MKKFLIKILVAFLFLYGLAWGLDYMISKGLQQMDDYRFMSWHEMKRGDVNAEILIMGNSRALSHFEPWTIDSIVGMNCYNIGLGGYPINVEVLKYDYYRLYNRKPKLIIQQVDYMTLGYITAPHQHQSEQFLPLIYDRRIHPELRRVGYSWLDIYCPLYRYWGYQMVIKNGILEVLGIKHYVNNPSRQGLHYEQGAWNGTELAKMDSIQAKINPTGKEYFEQYMRRCYDEGVRVLLVNSPTYIGATDKTVGLEIVNTYFDSIAAVYDTEYWNYANDSLCYDTAHFVVSVHMNPEATHRFSAEIANRLNEYIESYD